MSVDSYFLCAKHSSTHQGGGNLVEICSALRLSIISMGEKQAINQSTATKYKISDRRIKSYKKAKKWYVVPHGITREGLTELRAHGLA